MLNINQRRSKVISGLAFTFCVGWLIYATGVALFAQSSHGTPSFVSYPTPPDSDSLLFYLQRNKNCNTVIYEACFSKPGVLDKNSPIAVYWLRYADGKGRQELNWLESHLGYGVKARSTADGSYWVSFLADKKRGFKLWVDKNGRAQSHMEINNRWVRLQKIYVWATEGRWLPKVTNIEIFGKDLESGRLVIEKILP